MRILGLTGSIATGKSFVANCFDKEGYAVFYADKIAHEILEKDQAAFLKIAKEFPEAIIDNKIDRKILGKIVFANKQKLEILEAIIHPIIAQYRDEFLASQKKLAAKLVILEIPLLFEKSLDKICNYVLVTTASSQTQKQRIKARSDWLDEKIDQVVNLQLPQADKIARADFVINTDCSKEAVIIKVKEIIKQILS